MKSTMILKISSAFAFAMLAAAAQVVAQVAPAEAGATVEASQPLWRGMSHLDEWAANIRTNQSLRTWDRFRREQYEPFLRREIVQPYLDFSADRGTGRFAAGSNLLERFVTDITWFRSLDYGVQTEALFKAMRRSADDAAGLLDAGSDWPLFQVMAMFRGLEDDDWPNQFEMTQLVARVPDTPACSFIRVLGAGFLWLRPSSRQRPPMESTGLAAESIIHWLNHRRFTPAETRPVLLALELTAQFPGSRSSGGNYITVPEILNHCPELDPWIRELVIGCHTWRHDTAGSTEANTQALEHWFKAWLLRPEYPEAPFQILHGAMNDARALMRSGLPGIDEWFNRVQNAEVDYPPAYCQYAYPLSPIWGGRAERELAFAEAIRKAERPDLLFSFLYGHMLMLSIGNTDVKTWDFFGNDSIFIPFRDFYTKVAEVPSPLRNPPFVAAHFLALAEFSRGDIGETMRWARRLSPDDFSTGTGYAMGDFQYQTYWGSPANWFDVRAVNSVLAVLGGANGERLRPLVELAQKGLLSEFLERLNAERGKGLDLTPAEADYIGRVEAKALAQTVVTDGDAVSPRFDSLFTGWEHAEGWEYDDSDGVPGFVHANKMNPHGRISWNVSMPHDLRISGHIQFPVTNACLVVYLDWNSTFEREGPAVAFLRAKEGVYAQAGNSQTLDNWNTVAGRRWGVISPLSGPTDPPRRMRAFVKLPDAPGISEPVSAGDSRDAIDFEIESRSGYVSVAIDGKRLIVNAPLAALYALGKRTKAPLRIRGNGVKISGLTIKVLDGGERR